MFIYHLIIANFDAWANIYIDKEHTIPQRALACGPGIVELNQVYLPNHLTPSIENFCSTYINIFTRCTKMNLYILLIVIANINKGCTVMSYEGQLQTLTKQSIKHQVCPGETCHRTISESTITMFIYKGHN